MGSFFNIRFYLWVAVVGLALGLAHGSKSAPVKVEPGKEVIVGYYNSKNFQEGASDSVMKSGYAYEYLQQISDITGWRYKYVYGDWEHIYEKFLKGEVDVLVGLAFREDRVGLMEYPDYFMDSELHYVYVPRDDTTMSATDFTTLNGKRIGIVRNSNLESGFKAWAERQGLHVELVGYEDVSDVPKALMDGEVDAIANSAKFVDGSMPVKPLILYNTPKSYICVRKGAVRLLRELNAALESLHKNNMSSVRLLYDKYFGSGPMNEGFTPNELEWLESHDTLNVAYVSNYLPFCDRGEGGEATGVIRNIIEDWLEKTGLKGKLSVRYKEYSRYALAMDGVNRGEADVMFPQPNSRWFAEQQGLMVTKNLVDVPLSIVYKGDFTDSTLDRVSITPRPIQAVFVRENFPESKFVYVENGRQCLKAVKDGRATSTVMTSFRANPMMVDRRYSDLRILPIGKNFAYGMGVRKGDYGLLSLLNRGITVMDNAKINKAMYSYMKGYNHFNLTDFALNNILLLSIIFAGLALVVIGSLIFYILGVKKAQCETQMQVEVTEALSLDYPYAVLIDIEKGCWTSIKSDGKVLKESNRTYHESYDAAWKHFAKRYILEEDRDEAIKSCALDVVLENLRDRREYVCIYRAEWDGKEHYAQFTFTKVYSSIFKKEVLILGCKTADDIVARERKRQELMANALAVAERSNQSKTIFLNNMSHDIRTPMNAIIGFTNLAKSKVSDTEAVRSYLDKISVSSAHLLSLINNVLDMSRIESGKVKLSEERVHLPSIIREIQDMMQNSAQSKGISISFYDALSNEVVLADDLKLKQVLINVVGNAIKFTKPGGKVVLSVVERGGAPKGYANYVFTVADTGVGMSPSFREHIFEAFSRESRTTVNGVQGTGLGMAISKNIVDMMGGTITVDSTLNVGTKISIALSFKFAEDGKEVKEASSKDPIEGMFKTDFLDFKDKSVLLVEDNLLNQEIAVSILQELGFVVDVAGDGRQAVEKVRDNPAGTYNVILMDVQMPVMDGYEATRAIRSMADSSKALIPILAVTANAFDEDRQKAFEAGMNGHVSKPISVSELMEKMGKLI